jgi:small subunit ribosomal protein S20
MANHKSAKKRIKTSAKRRIVNQRIESKSKTLVKKAFDTTEKDEAEKIYKEAVAYIDKTAANGKLHKNTAARRKSALTKHLNSLQTAK